MRECNSKEESVQARSLVLSFNRDLRQSPGSKDNFRWKKVGTAGGQE